MQAKPRIAVAGFQHETNTFAPFVTPLSEFERPDSWPALTRGVELAETFAPLNIPIGGAIDAAYDCALRPILWASAEPGGFVTDEAFDQIAAWILEGLDSAGPLDGLYLDLHGAMVTETYEDGEGALLSRIRAQVGPDLPIAVSLDLHANLTPEMVEQATVITIFRTYPHLDMAETGARALALLLRVLREGRCPAKAFRQFPYLLPASAQCTDFGAAKTLYERLAVADQAPLWSADIALGFPAADIRDCGPALVAYAEEASTADAAAEALLGEALDLEPSFDNDLVAPVEAVRRAKAKGRHGRPVVLADVQDNPGAGASSDTTGLLEALVEEGAEDAVLGMLWDPETAGRACEAGPGAVLSVRLGGKSGPEAVQPYPARVRVESVSDGDFVCTGPMYGGCVATIGPSALLHIQDSGVRVAVSSARFQCLDQAAFRHLGVVLELQSIIAVKSTVHFRADFAPLAGEIILVDAPGYNVCRLNRVAYRNLRPGVRR